MSMIEEHKKNFLLVQLEGAPNHYIAGLVISKPIPVSACTADGVPFMILSDDEDSDSSCNLTHRTLHCAGSESEAPRVEEVGAGSGSGSGKDVGKRRYLGRLPCYFLPYDILVLTFPLVLQPVISARGAVV